MEGTDMEGRDMAEEHRSWEQDMDTVGERLWKRRELEDTGTVGRDTVGTDTAEERRELEETALGVARVEQSPSGDGAASSRTPPRKHWYPAYW